MSRAPKTRIDTATAAVEVMRLASRAIEPPDHAPLHPGALPFWTEIIATKARSEWTPVDLICASDLANAMAQLVENRRKLREEGEVLKNDKGAVRPNPRVAVVHGLHAQVKAARQALSIHGRAMGEARDVARRRAAAKEIEEGATLDDPLLAKPGRPH